MGSPETDAAKCNVKSRSNNRPYSDSASKTMQHAYDVSLVRDAAHEYSSPESPFGGRCRFSTTRGPHPQACNNCAANAPPLSECGCCELDEHSEDHDVACATACPCSEWMRCDVSEASEAHDTERPSEYIFARSRKHSGKTTLYGQSPALAEGETSSGSARSWMSD